MRRERGSSEEVAFTLLEQNKNSPPDSNPTYSRRILVFLVFSIVVLATIVLVLGVLLANESKDGKCSESNIINPECEESWFYVQNKKKGVVTSTHYLATQAGLNVLKRGGNAADAAAAVQFVLNVVQPHSTGIGGGCFILYYDASTKSVHALDGREEAPRRFNETSFCKNSTCLYDANCGCDDGAWDFLDRATGGHPVGVPGTIHAWDRLLKDYGTMSFAEVMQDAIRIGREGFPVYDDLYNRLVSNQWRMIQWESTKKVYYPYNNFTQPVPVGGILTNPDLSNTFELIASEGIDVFYTGEIAQDILKQVQTSVNPVTGLYGVMEAEDLGNYTSVYRTPITSTYRDFKMIGFPAPGSGGITLGLILNMLELLKLDQLEPGLAEYFHRLIDVQDIAFADRNRYVADMDWIDVPVDGLLDKEYAKNRSELLTRSSVSARINGINSIIQPGTPPGVQSWSFASFPETEKSGTTHFSVVDSHGNVASVTSTIEENFGCGVVVDGRGFLLNNELTDFTATPTDPTTGLLYANRPEGGKKPRKTALGADSTSLGGKRPVSSMTPTIAFKNYTKSDGTSYWFPYLAIGSPGGSRIIGQVMNALLQITDYNACLGAAVSFPRIISRNLGSTEVEMPIWKDNATIAILNARQFNVTPLITDRPLGYVEAASIIPTDEDATNFILAAASDPRIATSSALGF